MKKQLNITDYQEQTAYALFKEALPGYWKTADELPDALLLHLMLNGYCSANDACVGIALHWLKTPKIKREANRAFDANAGV